jgi:hypothetical protein
MAKYSVGFYCAISLLLWQAIIFTIEEKPIVVVIPSYNNERWMNLPSIFSQKYENYKVIYIDDCSTDNTYRLAQELVVNYHQQDRVTIIHNEERCGAMANWYRAIHMCPDDVVIVQFDGDDWPAHDGVLAYINAVYSDPNIWMTYGQFMEYSTGIKRYCYSKKFDEHVIQNNSFRKVEQLPMSHLRTCYAWLFKSIKLKDALYYDNFYPVTCDKVILACCVEMAARHHYCVPDVLYVWNNVNDISDHKVNQQLQSSLGCYVMSLPPYAPLDAPRKVDEVEELDCVSLIVVNQEKPSQEIIHAIAECKKQYDSIFMLAPEGQVYENGVSDSIMLVPYTQSNVGQKIQYCLQQVKGRYVQLNLQGNNPEINVALCAKLLKKTQVDVLFSAARNSMIVQIIQDKKLPKISFEYPAYAFYLQHCGSHIVPLDYNSLWRKECLASLVELGCLQSTKGLKEKLNYYVCKDGMLSLLLLS